MGVLHLQMLVVAGLPHVAPQARWTHRRGVRRCMARCNAWRGSARNLRKVISIFWSLRAHSFRWTPRLLSHIHLQTFDARPGPLHSFRPQVMLAYVSQSECQPSTLSTLLVAYSS